MIFIVSHKHYITLANNLKFLVAMFSRALTSFVRHAPRLMAVRGAAAAASAHESASDDLRLTLASPTKVYCL